jgi:hypothetical protein
MGRLLFTVEDTFAIRERGTILVPGIPLGEDDRWHIGDALVLRRPDGSVIETTIRGVDIHSRRPISDLPVLVPAAEEEIPVGTEVWSK